MVKALVSACSEVTVRPETATDQDAIYHVNVAAFGRPAEADLVNALRRDNALSLSLVAERDGQLVGHIAFSLVRVADEQNAFDAPALGPMAVLPMHQGQGIGSLLIEAGLAAMVEQRAKIVFVLGHPTYYPRFGFVPAQRYGIECEFDAPAEVFMVCLLQEGALQEDATRRHAVVHYRPAFHDI